MVPSPTMPSVLSKSSYRRGGPVAAPAPGRHAGMGPDQPARHREHQHQRVLGDRDGVGAAIVGDGHLRAPRRLEIDVVVAGAEQLHQPQPRRRPVERVFHGQARIAQHVFGLPERGRKLRPVAAHQHQLVAGRRQRAGDLTGLGRRRRDDDGDSCGLLGGGGAGRGRDCSPDGAKRNRGQGALGGLVAAIAHRCSVAWDLTSRAGAALNSSAPCANSSLISSPSIGRSPRAD